MISRLFKSILRHKRISTAVLLIVAVISYFTYQSFSNGNAATRYVVAAAEKGVLITSIAGTGQVNAVTQVDIKPKVSGNVLKILVQEGQQVGSGAILVQLDTKDLQTSLNQASLSLEMAKANLNSKLAGPTPEDTTIASNAVKTAQLTYDNSLTSLEKAKQDAIQSLQNAQFSLDKANAAVDNAQKQYDNTLATVSTTNDSTTQDIANIYSNAKATVDAALVSFRNAVPLADSILGIDQTPVNSALKTYLGALNQQSKINANNDYPLAKSALATLEQQYNATVLAQWNAKQVDDLLTSTLQTSQTMQALMHGVSEALSNTITGVGLSQSDLDGYKNTFTSKETDFINRISSIQSIQQSIVNATLGTSSTGIKNSSSIDTAKISLDNAKRDAQSAQTNYDQTKRDNDRNILTAQQDIQSKKIALDNAQASYDLKVAPPRAVDVASSKLQVKQAEESYITAKQNMQDATITAPITGMVAKINVHVGDIVTNGTATNGTAMITMITQQKYAQISLNEVDAAKVSVGQKATISFDALDGLSITGNVMAVDLLGTVSQGVVTYNVKVGFDTQDDRIKPGMSANVSIITQTKTDALLVPSGAIKSQNGQSYVQIVDGISAANADTAITQGIPLSQVPQQQSITVGSSNDTMTEIISGLQEGNYVVLRTVSSSQKTTTTSSSSNKSSIGIPGIGGGFR